MNAASETKPTNPSIDLRARMLLLLESQLSTDPTISPLLELRTSRLQALQRSRALLHQALDLALARVICAAADYGAAAHLLEQALSPHLPLDIPPASPPQPPCTPAATPENSASPPIQSPAPPPDCPA